MKIVSLHNYRQAPSRIAAAFLAVLIYGVLSVSHVAAAQPTMQGMAHMQHGQSVTCATLCNLTTPTNEQPVGGEDDGEDEARPTQTAQYLSLDAIPALARLHSDTARKVVKFEPPPGLPAYILLSVFRP